MIINKFVNYRTPRVLTSKEITSCKNYIDKTIRNYLKGGPKQFTVKDIFGYERWDWNVDHKPLNIIYDKWYDHYCKLNNKRKHQWTIDEIASESFKQSAISLGYLVKQVVDEMSDLTFKIENPTCWGIVYKIW